MRLKSQFFKPHPTIVFLCAFYFGGIGQEVINKRGDTFEGVRDVGFVGSEWILNIFVAVLVWYFGKSVFLEGEGSEVSDNFGLLGGEVELVRLQPPQHSIPHRHIFLFLPCPPRFRRESKSICQFLRLEIVEMGDAPVAEGRSACRSHHYYKQLMDDDKQRGKGWSEQRQKEQARRQINLQDNVEHYAANLIQRISDPGRNNDKQNQQLSKKINSQIQTNICSICLQLMIPPLRNPILLFPCGHNICKDCLFEHPPQGQIKKNLRLKLDKCSLCRQKIESYAVNQALMTLICTYSNNKHLIEQEQKRIQQHKDEQQEGQGCQQLKVRCAILEKQLTSLSKQDEEYSRNKAILAEVIETLKREKKKVDKQMEKVEEEGKLIGKCLSQKVEEMEFLQKKLNEAQDRSRVIDKALQPLRRQKERQQVMLVSRLIEKK